MFSTFLLQKKKVSEDMGGIRTSLTIFTSDRYFGCSKPHCHIHFPDNLPPIFSECYKQYALSDGFIFMAATKELIEQINRLFTENRMDAFMDYLAEDVVWEMYTSSSGHTTFNGIEDISQMDGSDMPEHTNFRFSTIVIEGDRASVQGSSTNKKADGTVYESNFCDVYQFKDDKIIGISSYVIDIDNIK